jgi:peroxiredoxin
MAMTPSTMLPLGTPAPDFALPDTTRSNAIVRLSDSAASRLLLVMFICNHCPFVKHVRAQLAALARDYSPKGVAIVAISSNDTAAHPDDSPANMTREALDAGYTFPYLFDESQSVAKAFRAACTPDFYLFGPAPTRPLLYRGQLDDSRPPTSRAGNTLPVTGKDLRTAIDDALAGRPVSPQQRPSIGCNIKWKPGNEPAYASA